jgi:hypothetical protein
VGHGPGATAVVRPDRDNLAGMKNTLLSALFVLLVFPVGASLRAQDATTNFTGTWSLDAAKSDFGPMPPPESIVHVIEHKEPSVKVVTTQKGAMGEVTTERQLTTDGKENVNKMRVGPAEQEVKSTTKWSGKALTTAFKLDMQGNVFDVNDSWKVSDDGKVLTIVRDIKSAQGDFTTTTVYNKQ